MSYIKRLLGRRTEDPDPINPLAGTRCIEPGDLVANGGRTGLVLEANLNHVSTVKAKFSRVLVGGLIEKWYHEDIDISPAESGRMAPYRDTKKKLT